MILRLGSLIQTYAPETASYYAAKPVYWLIAYLWNTNSDGDGYLRVRQGEFELIDADEDVTERETARAEVMFALLPVVVYIGASAAVAPFISGIGTLAIGLSFCVLSLLCIDQINQMTMTATRTGGAPSSD